MIPITAIIVDDEQDSRDTLQTYLGKYCPNVEVLTQCTNIVEARQVILKRKPQLIFLDIEMPHGNAFDLIEQFGEVPCEIIFVTAFSQYAIQAFNLSAVHYLLKPIDIEELEKAVLAVEKAIAQKEQVNRANILLENMTTLQAQHRKLVLPLLDGYEVIKMSEVVYCEAADNFTQFYLRDGSKKLICRKLKFYESALEPFGFYRIHRSHLINLDCVSRYFKGKGGSVVLENGHELTVAQGKKEGLLTRMHG